ncbi:MAG: sigma-70 family RNA polymerase sigma factor [Nocardioidaceae bacterium]
MSSSSTERAGRVDNHVLTRLYDEHAGVLLAYATRLTGDSHSAEDIVQETLLRAWRHPEVVSGPGSPRGWLMTVARNIAYDRHRARKARPREVEPSAYSELVAADDDIDRALESWTIADALSALSGAHRAVLVEVYYRGRSVAEAARTLGIAEGTVKSRTFYALRALRAALAERGVTT